MTSLRILLVPFATVALGASACGPTSVTFPPDDAGGLDRFPQLDGPGQQDGPAEGDALRQDAGPAVLYPDIRALQQDPTYADTLAPLDSRVRIEGAVVTASGPAVNLFFIQNVSGPAEYSGIIVKRSAAVPADLTVGDTVAAIEATLVEEARGCDWDAGACPTRHALTNVTLCTKGGTGTVPAPLAVSGADVLATTAKYDGVLLQLADSPLTVDTGGTTATTTPLSNGLAVYGQYYSPPGIVPSGTVLTTCVGVLDIYDRQWVVNPRSSLDLMFQDWPGDAGIQSDALQNDGGAVSDAAMLPDGATCSTGAPVVISQVYGAGGNGTSPFQNDFIELYNRTGVDISLDGWSVQYASVTGTSWLVTHLSGTIGPGKYYLVKEGAGNSCTDGGAHPCGDPLPSADATGNTSMAADKAKVALVASTTPLTGSGCPLAAPIVDFVGYGTTADCKEGATAAPTLSNTTSDQRGNAGCSDTDVNGTDFATDTPNPRNSATTVAPCGC
jgi:hypothetical protein